MDYFEHFRPGREQALIDLLISLNRHAEFKLLDRHLALFGRSTIIRATTSRPATTLQAGIAPSVPRPAVNGQIFRIGFNLSAVDACATINDALAAVFIVLRTSLGLARRRLIVLGF